MILNTFLSSMIRNKIPALRRIISKHYRALNRFDQDNENEKMFTLPDFNVGGRWAYKNSSLVYNQNDTISCYYKMTENTFG